MSGSYFVRHTEGVSVRKEDLQRLWSEDRIAIHFPGETSSNEQDSESLLAADYGPPNAKAAIGAFAELCEEGGYVWAQSYVSDRVKVGYIRGLREGGSGAVMERGALWDLRGKTYPGREDGHPATLKTLPMERVKEVAKKDAMHLRAAQPPSLAFCRWTGVGGGRLRDLVEEGTNRRPEWARLSTAEQEAACAEFLRERHEGCPELPILRRLLLPVGRGLEDVDVYGFDEDGKHLYAQVTHHRWGTAVAKKAERLGEYAGRESGGVGLVFFCTGPTPQTEDAPASIYFVSVDDDVMPWLLEDGNYRTALFGA